MIIPFGKYKGQDFDDIPIDYIQWLEEQNWLKDELRQECQFQLDRRLGDRPGKGKVIK